MVCLSASHSTDRSGGSSASLPVDAGQQSAGRQQDSKGRARDALSRNHPVTLNIHSTWLLASLRWVASGVVGLVTLDSMAKWEELLVASCKRSSVIFEAELSATIARSLLRLTEARQTSSPNVCDHGRHKLHSQFAGPHPLSFSYLCLCWRQDLLLHRTAETFVRQLQRPELCGE